MLNTLAELHSSGRTIIVITHDPEVARCAQRIIRIVDGQIVSDSPNGGPSIRPQKEFVSVNTLNESKTAHVNLIQNITRVLKYMFIPTLQALQTQKLRTALTMTGLLLGVSSVFIMLTLTGRVGKIFEDFLQHKVRARPLSVSTVDSPIEPVRPDGVDSTSNLICLNSIPSCNPWDVLTQTSTPEGVRSSRVLRIFREAYRA